MKGPGDESKGGHPLLSPPEDEEQAAREAGIRGVMSTGTRQSDVVGNYVTVGLVRRGIHLSEPPHSETHKLAPDALDAVDEYVGDVVGSGYTNLLVLNALPDTPMQRIVEVLATIRGSACPEDVKTCRLLGVQFKLG